MTTICPGTSRLLCSLLLACCLSGWLGSAPMLQGVHARDRLLYWNISNPIFKVSGENVYLVPKYDRLVIVCPTNGLEFYRLYWTHSASAASACDSSHSQVFLLLQCANPGDSGAFQVLDFSPIPGAPTFERTVYIFTPSSGSRHGILQTRGGACEIRNMRLSVDLGNPDLLTQPSAQQSTTKKAETTKSATTTTTKTTAEAAAAATSAGSNGSGSRGPLSTATSNTGQDNRLPPTAQDLARRAQTNVIVAAPTNHPSTALLAAAALCRLLTYLLA